MSCNGIGHVTTFVLDGRLQGEMTSWVADRCVRAESVVEHALQMAENVASLLSRELADIRKSREDNGLL